MLHETRFAPAIPGSGLSAARISQVRAFDQHQSGGAVEVRRVRVRQRVARFRFRCSIFIHECPGHSLTITRRLEPPLPSIGKHAMTINPSAADATPDAVRRSLIMVLTSLPLGVTLFAAVVFWLRRGESYAEVSLLYEIWAIGTVVAITAARLVRTALRRAP